MKIVITGKGGQGVVLLTRVISMAAHVEGKSAISTETLGMSQRGASVISFIKLGDYLNPLVRQGTADSAFCLLESESPRAISYLAPETALFLNAGSFSPDEAVKKHLEEKRIRVLPVDADQKAEALGNARGSNLFLLGFSLPFLNEFIRMESVAEAIRRLLRPQLWDTNIEIIKHGVAAATLRYNKN